MLQSVWGVVRDGRIELSEETPLVDGTRLLVTILPEDESSFWAGASQSSLDEVWDNPEDDVYAELLQA
ncbi:MAG: hypothetical protein AABP62_25880 [Planctomycetota bacterium]